MRWTKPLAIALVINIHTSGCIGGLLSVSAAMAASLSSYNVDSSELMTIAEPEDFLCTNQTLVRQQNGIVASESEDTEGCGSSTCLERSHQDRKERHLLADLVQPSEVVAIVNLHVPLQEFVVHEVVFSQRAPPLFEHAKQHTRSLAKRE